MVLKVAINGFGRIGRIVLRALHEQGRKDIQVVAINDLGSVETNAHLLRYDSIHGPFPGKVKVTKTGLNIGRGNTKVIAERDPAKLPWAKLGVDIALECTGLFTSRDAAAKHLEAGAKKVLVSAPTSGADLTMGQYGAPGAYGHCVQGHTFAYGRHDNWGATELEVWYLP